jgi:putative proteasome-type protease
MNMAKQSLRMILIGSPVRALDFGIFCRIFTRFTGVEADNDWGRMLPLVGGRLSDWRRGEMTYCLGIVTKHGLIMASDSRSNAGYDQVNVVRKMHTFVQPGERVFVVLTSGSLSLTQSIMTLVRRDFDAGKGLATAPTMYDAARVLGQQVRKVSELDREALERDEYRFNVHMLIGGQVKGSPPELYLIYPQGNPLAATQDSPFLQIGETKYGRPILDRGIRFDKTTLEEAAKYALLSMDSTMKSNVTVGPPIDLAAYSIDELSLTRQRRFTSDDPDLNKIRQRWEQALRQGISKLPELRFRPRGKAAVAPQEETIEVVEPPAQGTPGDANTAVSEPQAQLSPQTGKSQRSA